MNTARFRFLLAVLFGSIFLVAPLTVRSQSQIEDALKQYDAGNVKGYVQPIADLFGANMHAGYFHTADIPRFGFHMELDFVAMAAEVSDDQKTYTATAPAGFNPGTFETATIFGDKGTTVTHSTMPALSYRGSDGIINAKVFPFGVPQLTLGYLYGTEATFRYVPIPEMSDGKFPKTTLFGLGIRHSVSQYFSEFPLDVAAGFSYNSLTVGDIVDFKGLSFGAQVSKSFSILTLYGGLAWEKSTINLKYTSTDPRAPFGVDVSFDGANKFRATTGLCLKLAFLSIFADANFGTVTNVSGGIGFGN